MIRHGLSWFHNFLSGTSSVINLAGSSPNFYLRKKFFNNSLQGLDPDAGAILDDWCEIANDMRKGICASYREANIKEPTEKQLSLSL